MKKIILGLLLASAFASAGPALFPFLLVTQSAKIGGSGTAVSSAALEINSTTKGLLLPRMTTTQQNAISSPAEGLILYDNVLHAAAIYDGTAWQNMFDAGNLTGTLPAGTLPNPSTSTLGGVNSSAAVAHNFLTAIGTNGAISKAQPAFTDISGTLSISQGGTGQTAKAAAFDALSPLTTTGDILTYGSSTNGRIGTVSGDVGKPLVSGGGSSANNWATLAFGGGGTGLTALGTANQIIGTNNGATAMEWKAVTVTAAGNVNAPQIGVNDSSAGSAVFVKTSAVGTPSMTLKAITSQTADLLQIMDSSNVPQMIFTSGGNFKFFHNVASPTTRMDLRGSVSQSSANSGNNARYSMFIGDPQAPGTNLGAGIALGGPQTSSTDLTPYAYIWVNKNNATSGDVGASLHFATRNNSTGNAQRSLELDSNGNADFFGTLGIDGSSSGKVTIQTQAAAGTYNFNLPIAAGTAGQVLVSQGGGSNAMTWGAGSGGGGVNFISNPDAEVDTTGWATYADAAGTMPVDGTGGSPSVTWTRTTSTPLTGTGSFLFTKGASNRQGDGASYTFSTDNASQAKVLAIDFDYVVASGTFAAGSTGVDSDIEVYVYDVTNAVLIQPSTYKLYSSTTAPPSHFSSTFQTASNSTSYRLIFHTATTSASAFTVQFDSVTIAPSKYVYGTPITEWQAYTPTFSVSLGTASSINFMSRRVGSSLEVEGTFTTGSTLTGVEAQVSLGYAGAAGNVTTLSTLPTLSRAGELRNTFATTTNFGGTTVTKEASKSYMTFSLINSSNGFTKTNGNSFGTSQLVSLNASFPIAGWSSTVQMSDIADAREVGFFANKSAGAVTANTAIPTWTNVLKDTHAAFNSSTGVYTVPTPGDYFVATNIWTNSSSVTGLILKNGSIAVSGVRSSSTLSGSASGLIPCVAGDTITVAADASVTLSTSTVQTTLSIFKLSGTSAIGATENIAARYFASATTLSGSLATIVWTTKDYDTHNQMSSGVYTIQAAGKYAVGCTLAISGTFALNSQSQMEIQKNGVATKNVDSYAAGVITADHISVEDEIQAVSGDTVRCQASSAATGPTIVSSNTKNTFTIHRIGL